jgi:hypothetical protein
MMAAARTSETSVDNHFTRQYTPEDKLNLNVQQVCHFKRTTNLRRYDGRSSRAVNGVKE